MEEILFSVVMPVYNVEPYIKECLDSICASKENFEIIAVDDGSTDGSLKLLQNYPDARLKIFHKENEGVFKTWQYGVRQSTGNYIIFIDPDDYIDPKLFTDMKALLSRRDYDLIMFLNYCVEDGKVVIADKFAPKIDNDMYFAEGEFVGEKLEKYLDEHLHEPEDDYMLIPTTRWGKVFKASLLKNFLPELLKERVDMFEDDTLCLPFATKIRSLYISKKFYYFYRFNRQGSICTSMNMRKKWLDGQKVVEYIENYEGGIIFSKKYKDYYFKRKYIEVFCYATEKKCYSIAREILANERFQKTILSETKGLKGFLWRHKMVKTFRFFRKVSTIFE